MTPAPISVERLSPAISDYPGNHFEDAEPIMVATLDGEYVRHSDYAALLQQLAELEAEVERLRRECDLRKHAVDRWVPCPDHRDKTDGRCYVCASEAAERARDEATGLLRKIDGLIPGEILGTQLCEELDAFLAANK